MEAHHPDTDPDAAELVTLVAEGYSAAEALDYWAVDVLGYTAADWARVRGVTRGAVGQNIREVRDRR